jgi:hypothetical protein
LNNKYLSTLPAYNEKPFLANGVSHPQFQFGEVIVVAREWYGNYYKGLKKGLMTERMQQEGLL